MKTQEEILKDRVSFRPPDDVKALLESLIGVKARNQDRPVSISQTIFDCIRLAAPLLEQDLRDGFSIPSHTLPESKRALLFVKQVIEKHLEPTPGAAA